MRHRIGADLAGDLDLLLGDERPGDRGPQQVLPLVQGVGAEHREHIVADEFLAQVLDEDVLRLDPSSSAFSRAGLSSSPWPRSAVNVTTSQP